MVTLTLLLVVLDHSEDLGGAAWVAGLGCAAVLTGAIARGLAGAGRARLGPADLVTLGRGLLGCAAAALAVEAVQGHDVATALSAVVVPALLLDAVDGPVARRTGTTTPLGARLDGEVDAFVILVLSVAVASSLGWWVLLAGLVRYAFAVAGWVAPWMRGRLEFRYWRKVVTAVVGVVLAVAASGVLAPAAAVPAVLAVLALLAESFGRDVWWLWRRRAVPAAGPGGRGARATPAAGTGGRRVRRVAASVVTIVAVLGVWLVLVVPSRPDLFAAGAFLRLPAEGLLLAAVVLALPREWSRPVALVLGAVLAVLAVLRVLDLGTFAVLDRPFDVVADRGQLLSGLAFVRDSLGTWAAVGGVVAAALVVASLSAFLPWAVARVGASSRRHRRAGWASLAVVTGLWAGCALTGARVGPGEPVAALDAGPFLVGKVEATAAAYRSRQDFDGAIAADGHAGRASGDLAALHGKDVLLVFVESYGRVAVEGQGSEPVRRLLDAGTARLAATGYLARSGYLTSPTFGGSSWLAHSTLQSGLWVSDQDRYDQLLTRPRTTLNSAFADAGWRTVAVMPSTRGSWPQGRRFYGFDHVYGRTGLGYAGPTFGFSAMPDQFTLEAFARRELDGVGGGEHRRPVMAELELTSSHGPWAPLPTTVDPARLGDGSVYDGIRADAVSAGRLWSDRRAVPEAYRTSIEYSLTSLLSFVEQRRDEDLVLVVLGDHQPSTVVSGFGGNRDVPVSVIARDPAVLAAAASWGWQEGLRPGPDAPVWRMDAFRDRFLSTYSSAPPAPGVSARGAP